MKKILKITGGIFLFLIVSIILMFLSASQVFLLILLGGAIVFIIAGIQIFLDRKNLAKLDEIDLDESDNEQNI